MELLYMNDQRRHCSSIFQTPVLNFNALPMFLRANCEMQRLCYSNGARVDR